MAGRTRARAMTTRPSSGSLTNALGVRPTRLVRSDEGDPHEQNGEDREHRGDTRSHASAAGAGVSAAAGVRPRLTCGVPVAPQPPHVAAERLGKQGKRDDEGGLGQSQRQDVRSRDRQNDPLSRSDDLAPVARRQRLTHPRQQPPGCEERVACRADREHPRAGRAGDVHAEDEDQERVDLTVEARAQRRRRPVASRDPSVDRVQRERDDRECHQHRDRRGLVERVRDQRRDADGERRPSKRHPVGRAQPVGAVAGEAARQCRIRDHAAGDSDDPAGAAEADGPREGGEQQHLGDQPGRRAGVNRSHRASVFVATWATHGAGSSGSTGNSVVRDRQLCARGTAMKQDERAPFVRALQRARVSAYAPGEFVEQESFMRAGRDSGPGRSGRHRTRGLRAGPLLRRCRARTVHHSGAGLHLSGRGLQLQRHRHRT